jgi:cytochrome b6
VQIPSKTIPENKSSWLSSRLPIAESVAFLRHKMVPWHRGSYWFLFGGIALLLFGVQVFTGVLLMFYYVPTPETAYETVLLISGKVPFGWLVRSIHSWSSNLMILALFIHLFSVYFMRAYRPPRELTWVSGAVLLVLAMTFGFSGYLLPWTKLSYFATKIGTDLTKLIPVFGGQLRLALLGADEISGPTLTRFYAFHVGILPPIFVVLLGVHLLLVQRLGMSECSPGVHRLGACLVPVGGSFCFPALGGGREGRSARFCTGRHPARMVLHVPFAVPQIYPFFCHGYGG